MRTFLATLSLLVILAAFAVTDAVLLAPPLPFFAQIDGKTPIDPVIPKQENIDVVDAMKSVDMEAFNTQDSFFINSIITDAEIKSYSVVRNNDRIGGIAYVTSPTVKSDYTALKQVLHKNFSSEVQDLQDETKRSNNEPVRNQLTFLDPGISSDRLVFLRVRDRLYEVRIIPGNEGAMQPLIDVLAR